MTKHSVLVVGGGPAGTATALSLMQSARCAKISLDVTLICAPESPRLLIGETIPPAASAYLSELNVAHILEQGGHLSCPGSISVWGNDKPGFNDFFFMPQGQGYHLNRRRFNQQLQDECSISGVNVLVNTKLKKLIQQGNGYLVELDSKESEALTYFDFIVDASGHHGAVIRHLDIAKNQLDRVISICAFFDLAEQPESLAHTLVSSDPLGWWYGTQIPDKRALISLCTDEEELKRHQLASPENWYQALLANHWFFAQCCQQFAQLDFTHLELHIHPSPSGILSNVVGETWLAVGDAASCYDSISSAGITKALYHGNLAGKAITDYFENKSRLSLLTYQLQVFADFRAYYALQQDHYRTETRYAQCGFWQRRRR
jgi:flavin-dependent dehydrogenase